MSTAVTSTLWEKQRPPRRHVEDDLQKQVMEFLDWALPPEGIAYAVPNGGLRSRRVAARLKGTGVKAGIPDIAIVYRGKSFFVELKAGRGIQSAAQREMADKLNYCGACVLLCRRIEDVEAGLLEACIPLRNVRVTA